MSSFATAATVTPTSSSSLAEAKSLRAGARVDRYEIVRPLGIGGSADVYEAEHLDLGRRVALKVVRCGAHETDETLARFRREARTSGSLRHPNIADVFDVGYTEDGSPYLVMELLNGESLGAWITRGPLSFDAAVEVGTQLADALSFVHTNGILHRDVKPDNIVMHQERGRTVAKLVDFGISKPVMDGPAERGITREGLVVGTPHYMAPEYLAGGRADHGTDTYSAGVVMYEALAGRPPFDEVNMTALVASILRDEAPSLSKLRPDCPASLVALVERAISRDVSKRFGGAAELAQALRDVGAELGLAHGHAALGQARVSDPSGVVWTHAGSPTTERPISTASRPHERSRRRGHATWALGAAATVLVVASGAWMVGLGAQRMSTADAQPQDAAKVAPVVSATNAAKLDRAPSQTVALTQAAAPAYLVAPIPANPMPITPTARTRSRSSADTAVVSRAAVAEPTGAAAAPVREARAGASSAAARALTRRALSAYATGQFPRALALYREAVRQDPTTADAWRGLGAVSTHMGQPVDARRAFRKYLELAPHAPDAGRVRAALAGLPR